MLFQMFFKSFSNRHEILLVTTTKKSDKQWAPFFLGTMSNDLARDLCTNQRATNVFMKLPHNTKAHKKE